MKRSNFCEEQIIGILKEQEAEMAAKSVGEPDWRVIPNPVVTITPSYGHQNGQRLYS